MNISKKQFPFVMVPQKGQRWPYTNFYRVYHLNKRQIGNLLNIWFSGIEARDKDGRIICSELWTVKKVDKESMAHLYDRRYNPISLKIMCHPGAKFTINQAGEVLYNFKATIHSVDDSSYGMWWNGITLAEIEKIKKAIMGWMEPHEEINGLEWFSIGQGLGAVDFDTN